MSGIFCPPAGSWSWRCIITQLRIDIDNALAGLADFGIRTCASIGSYGAVAAGSMEEYAKRNRPWTDRTGNARQTMEGVSGWEVSRPNGQLGHDPAIAETVSGSGFSVGVEGHMPYSVFLELGYGGRFSVLAPTVRHFAPELLLGFARCISSMK